METMTIGQLAAAAGVNVETVRYYQDISDGVDGPLMVYNWPHGTGVDIGPDLAERIAAVGNVVAIKDSTPNLEQFFESARRVVGSVRVFGPKTSPEEFWNACTPGTPGERR